MLSILTVNIGSAALPRAKRILHWLQNCPEDVFVLTETSSGAGTRHILNTFRDNGCVIARNDFASKERGVAIISMVKKSYDSSKSFMSTTIPERVAALHVHDGSTLIDVVGLYIPSRNQQVEKITKKQYFIDSFFRKLETIPKEMLSKTIVCGDYSAIGRDHLPKYRNFLAFEYDFLKTLRENSLADAFTLSHPNTQDYSWVGRTGDGYRYDIFMLERVYSAR